MLNDFKLKGSILVGLPLTLRLDFLWQIPKQVKPETVGNETRQLLTCSRK